LFSVFEDIYHTTGGYFVLIVGVSVPLAGAKGHYSPHQQNKIPPAFVGFLLKAAVSGL